MWAITYTAGDEALKCVYTDGSDEKRTSVHRTQIRWGATTEVIDGDTHRKITIQTPEYLISAGTIENTTMPMTINGDNQYEDICDQMDTFMKA